MVVGVCGVEEGPFVHSVCEAEILELAPIGGATETQLSDPVLRPPPMAVA